MTGHGGNEFLKFQDNEEISSKDIADCFEQMWQKQRSRNAFLFLVEKELSYLIQYHALRPFHFS
jgi:phosphatidylinositol glycan class K